MGSLFDGDRQRRRSHELPLAEYPEWGLDILRGLYGPETIAKLVSDVPDTTGPGHPPAHDQHVPDGPWAARLADYDWSGHRVARPATRTDNDAADDDPEEPSPYVAQLDAVSELMRYVERHFKNRH